MKSFIQITLLTILAFIGLTVSASAHDDDIVMKLEETLQILQALVTPPVVEVAALPPTKETCEFTFMEDVSVESVNALLEKVAPCLKAGIQTTLLLSSPGGTPSAAAMFFDMIIYYGDRKLLKVVGIGDIASAAVTMYLAGGERIISKHATILVHEATYTFTDVAMDPDLMRENARSMQSTMDILTGVIAEQTNLTHDEAVDFANDHTIFTADEAVKYGFADKILGDK